MVKGCDFCGRYFTPDKRVGERQKACSRKQCQRARKQVAQSNWVKKNASYFKGRSEYVKQWRTKRKEDKKEAGKGADESKKMLQDEIPSSKPLYKLVFLIPGGAAEGVLQDEILFKRVNRRTFASYGGG